MKLRVFIMADIFNILLCASKLAFLALSGREDSFELQTHERMRPERLIEMHTKGYHYERDLLINIAKYSNVCNFIIKCK